MPIDLEEVHEYLIHLAYDAGAMILAATPSSVGAENKKNCTPSHSSSTASRLCSWADGNAAADLVTETDRAVELMITESLQTKYPDFEYSVSSLSFAGFTLLTACSFMGEETYNPGTRLGNRPTFICDPIDG